MELKKRGFFFTLDVAISLMVLITGFVLVFSILVEETAKEQPYFIAEDSITFLSNTRVGEVSGNEVVSKMVKSGLISIGDYDKTLLEEITYFYVNGDVDNAREFTRVVFENVTPFQYSVNFTIDREGMYNFSSQFGTTPENASVLIASRRLVLVILDDLSLSGPHIAEVQVWQ